MKGDIGGNLSQGLFELSEGASMVRVRAFEEVPCVLWFTLAGQTKRRTFVWMELRCSVC